MLVEALLHDFLSDVEKSYNDIVVYLERSWSHPTRKMWVDTIIYPTFLAMELVRAERETDWLLQQDCLWRMLPVLFAAGHHWYARYTIAFLLEMQFGEQIYIRQGKGAGGLLPNMFSAR